jgi:uncharacterized protein YtpQ (UPF0354 family)
MTHQTLAKFEHPAQVYRLEYPAHWENLVKEEGRSCGFGPRERDNVGLWISILPFQVDTDRLLADLRGLFQQAMAQAAVTNIREDRSLRHFALKADITSPGQGGYYWIVAGGDVVLLASTQVPAEERDAWNPIFDRVMTSLLITREDDLAKLKVTNALLVRLRERFPDQEYEYDSGVIRGQDHVIYTGNLARQIQMDPDRQDELIDHFITGLTFSGDDAPGAERLDAVRELIVPVLKPADYVRPDGPTARLVSREWLGDVIICYAIQGAKTFRFVIDLDLNRWGMDTDQLHELSIENLARLPWPERIEGSGPANQRVAIVSTRDSFDAARLLHPELHDLFSQVLGSPFLAGVPDRDTLVVFTARNRRLRKRIATQLKKDFGRAAYPISPHPYLVTRDGIALAK